MNFDPRGIKKNNFLRTVLVTRDIGEAIKITGLKMKPCILSVCFSTGLDITESRGLISHPWRQFIKGHKGDIETKYSTNKRLPPAVIEDIG